jgi:hypothetical protein
MDIRIDVPIEIKTLRWIKRGHMDRFHVKSVKVNKDKKTDKQIY